MAITIVVALVFSLRQGAASFSTPPKAMDRHNTIKEP
jgi:hypothetical protein